MNKIISSILALFIMHSAVNAQTTHLYGYVVEKNDTAKFGVSGIPFCTVKYCDIDNHDIVEYIGMTDLRGFYDMGYNIPIKNYHVVIEAPGYTTISKDMGKFPVQEELSLHFEMTRSGNVPEAVKHSYSLSDLNASGKQKLTEVIAAIPDIIIDEYGSILTKDEGSVKILLGGQTLPPDADLSQLDEIPLSYVSRFDYFDLTEFNTVYSGTLSIMVPGPTTELQFKPFVTDMFDL